MEAKTVYRVEANPEKGFHAAYFLLVPASTHGIMKTGAVPIAVAPNNTGKTSDDIAFHEERAIKRLKRNGKPAALFRTAMLVPAFMRPKAHRKIYTHALDRDDNDSVPYDDSYDAPHTALVNGLFGETPVERWDDAEALYRRENRGVTFRLYARAGHKITKEMLEDLIGFTQRNL